MAVEMALDRRGLRRHRLRNLFHSALLIIGMIALLALCMWMLWGGEALIWALAGAILGLSFSPNISARTILSMYRARPLSPTSFPEGYEIVGEIARRARLPHTPRLYYVPSRMLNAFAVGGRGSPAIAVTDGLLRNMSARELAGVLAHEISHVRNRDLWVMNLADMITRLTSIMSVLGMFLLVFMLPLILFGNVAFPVLLPFVLLFAPTIGSLLQLALSRAREYDADLDAVMLTADPQGLASALDKLERLQGRFWERIMFPGQRIPDPSLLRTHPPTEERIRRLLAVKPQTSPYPPIIAGSLRVPGEFRTVTRDPRRRWTGAWY